MRVTTRMLFDTHRLEISKSAERLLEYQKRVASGKRINKPSDDPMGLKMVLGYRTDKSRIAQYQRNVDQANSWLVLADNALAGIESALERAVEVAMVQASDTSSASNRMSAAMEVENIFDQIMQLANTRLGNRSIFAGTRTDITPFTKDAAYNITYQGDNKTIDLYISQNISVTVNLTGKEVFIDSNIFGILKDLRDSLLSNDRDGIAQQLPLLDNALASVGGNQSKIGAKNNRIDTMKVQLQNVDLRITELMSNLEDADMFQAITELTNQQIIYEATLRTISLVSDLNLAKFL
ncbi:MAG: flagellar hook-associated protein FlgL [Deltaproteobacteria bacterium]|nr:flagellar hook-associated protein FlgL [Deltaproteobacteria bacterium]